MVINIILFKGLNSIEYVGPKEGAKKVLDDHEMPEAYNPSYVEAAWQEWWYVLLI